MVSVRLRMSKKKHNPITLYLIPFSKVIPLSPERGKLRVRKREEAPRWTPRLEDHRRQVKAAFQIRVSVDEILLPGYFPGKNVLILFAKNSRPKPAVYPAERQE